MSILWNVIPLLIEQKRFRIGQTWVCLTFDRKQSPWCFRSVRRQRNLTKHWSRNRIWSRTLIAGSNWTVANFKRLEGVFDSAFKWGNSKALIATVVVSCSKCNIVYDTPRLWYSENTYGAHRHNISLKVNAILKI